MGSEGNGSPVGYPAKQEVTRTSQPKQAASALQAREATIEVAGKSRSPLPAVADNSALCILHSAFVIAVAMTLHSPWANNSYRRRR